MLTADATLKGINPDQQLRSLSNTFTSFLKNEVCIITQITRCLQRGEMEEKALELHRSFGGHSMLSIEVLPYP